MSVLGIAYLNEDRAVCLNCCWLSREGLLRLAEEYEDVVILTSSLREVSPTLYAYGLYCDQCGAEIFSSLSVRRKVANKYLYLHVLQGYYGSWHGWEDICQSESLLEMLEDLRAYRDNAPEYTYRIIKRRELNPKDDGRKIRLYEKKLGEMESDLIHLNILLGMLEKRIGKHPIMDEMRKTLGEPHTMDE